MNIYALKGHKVKVTKGTVNNGWDYDSELVKENLELEKEYTIERTDVGQSDTSVYLQEFPGVCFNSVNFEDVTIQSKEDANKHHDYKMWNR